MSQRIQSIVLLLLILGTGTAHAADLGFFGDTTVAWLDDRRVIAVRADAPLDQDTEFAAVSSDPGVLKVLKPAAFLKSHDTGFLRIEGLREGTAELSVGDATLTVHVKPSTADWLREQRRPRVTSPTRGAAVWGTVGVSVVVFDDLGRLSNDPTVMRLRLPGGKEAVAHAVSPPREGPHRRFSFALDTEQLAPGPVEITAELDHPIGGPSDSRVFPLSVYRPAEITLVQGEAEDWTEYHRPRRFGGTRKLPLGDDDAASGDRFVANNSSNPALTLELPVDEAGWYQVIARAQADTGAGTLPALAVRLDANDRDTTVTQLADTAWHRVAVGTPFHLTPPTADERRPEPPSDGDQPAYNWPDGRRVLTLRFANDFSAGRNEDRNLRLDRYEIARLPGRPAAPVAAHAGEEVRPDAVRGLFVALSPSLDQCRVGGDFTVEGLVGNTENPGGQAPIVTLELNGKAVETQHTSQPVFIVSPGQLNLGANTVQLVANDMATDAAASSSLHVVTLPDSLKATPARKAVTFHAANPAWDDIVSLRRDKARVVNEPAFAFFSPSQATLRLQEDLAGEFQVYLSGWADEFDGPALAEVRLIQSTDSVVVGSTEFKKKVLRQRVGNITLKPGPKSLQVAFTNDKYDADTGRDRNLYIHALRLREVRQPDQTPPAVALCHPGNDAVVGRYDAAVVDVADGRGVVWAQAVINGEPTGLRHKVEQGASRVLVPLVLRNLPAGPINLAVRVSDQAGNTADTTQASITLAPDHPATAHRRAVHLLNRLGYGPESDLLADVLADGFNATLDRLLSSGWDPHPGLLDAWAGAAADRTNEESLGDLRHRAAQHQLLTPDPWRGRLTMFLDNHFTTWWRKAQVPMRLNEHARWVRLGAAPFPEQLMASATSPAMLRYLDQQRSFANRLNENYAREIMELHTLGVDAGYTQEDVTSLAKLLTGWSYTQLARDDGHGRLLDADFRYIASRNLPDAQTVFGLRFEKTKQPRDRFDRARLAVEMLAAHPATAAFLSEKLVGHYAGLPADPQLVEAGRDAFLETHGDLREVIKAIATHPRFLTTDAPKRVSHPAEFAFRLQRLAGVARSGPVINYTNSAGFGLFDRDTPDGYPEEDDAYADSNATLQRWRYAGNIADAFVAQLPTQLAYPSKLENEQAEAAWRQKLIDHLAGLITGDLLSPTSNQAALDVLTHTELKGWQRLRLTAQFIAQLPESALR